MSRSINPAMVTLARESRGWTQSELAKRMRDHQAKISKIEAGLLRATDDTLKALCAALSYPPEFFYQDDELHGIDTSILFHRRRQAIGSRTLAKIHAVINIRRINVDRLLKSVDIDARKPFPVFEIDEFGGDPRAVAQAVRATWTLPRGPVASVTKAIEDAGGLVIRCDFETRLVDAISQWIPGYPPMFFVNAGLLGDRLRWTLAHEIGHVVMHRVVGPNIEREADEFASTLLMPADDIRPYFTGGITPAKLASLKPLWKVSMQALLKTATDYGAITERRARDIWMQFGKAGYRTREPSHLDIPIEEPRVFQEIINFHTAQLKFSPADLARVVNLYESEVRTTYLGKPAAALRAVKDVPGTFRAPGIST
jgi:Zn-dependent peptidase ImmA (M78 family)/transcriptional regulator with XRE-family HTH domain